MSMEQTKQATSVDVATQLVDAELKNLRETFIYFTQEALIDADNSRAVDVRIVMGKVLEGLIRSHGMEDADTIRDTAPRDQILERIVAASATAEYSWDSQLLKHALKDEKDFLNYQKLKEKGDDYVAWIDVIATEYSRINKMPITRIYEHDNLVKIIKFVRYLIDQYFDQFSRTDAFEGDEKGKEIFNLIDKEAPKFK